MSRWAALLLPVLAGVILADRDGSALLEEVVALRRVLEARAVGPDYVTEFYDLEALADRVGSVVPALPLLAGSTEARSDAEGTVASARWNPDELVAWVQSVVEPASWNEEGARLELGQTYLAVTARPRVHRDVRALLARLAEHARPRFAIELRLVPATESDEIVEARRIAPPSLIERSTTSSVRFPAVDDIRAPFRAGRTVSFVQDYDVEVASDAKIGDPQTGHVFEGLAGDIRVCGDSAARGALVHLQFQWSKLRELDRAIETEHGAIALPSLDVVRLKSSFWLPLDRWVRAASCTRGAVPCHVLVRVARR